MHPERLQFSFGRGLAGPAIGGDRGRVVGASRDPADRRRQLGELGSTIPGQLGLTNDGQVELMYGALSDNQQHDIIERFSLSDSPVRAAHRPLGL